MKVQTKILLLLLLVVLIFVGGLSVVRFNAERRFKLIADERALERNRIFDEFLSERGDQLSAIVDDSTNWDDLVRALKSNDQAWAESNIPPETLTAKNFNAFWIYKPDLTLFHSKNNRYTESLREAPLPREAWQRLFAARDVSHFFVNTDNGWMEVRGATIHPSRDRYRETPPQGYFLAGRFWIDENIRRMSLFTGYSIRIVPYAEARAERKSAEEQGLISFTRTLSGWDGKPIAQIQVEHDSPLIREFNRAERNLFFGLIIFAALLFLLLSVSLIRWVRRPLHVISDNLEKENPEGLLPLAKKPHEFGRLADLILKFRATEHTLHQAEEQLRHSQKLEAVGRLAGGVAHDFNNLLTAIIGYSELIEKRAEGATLEQAQLIRKAGEQAAGLTKQLLAFSRKQILDPRVLDLNALVREMEKLLQRVIGEGIRIEIETAAQIARVRADPNQLEQVLLNLGVNGRDAMPRGGTLRIMTQDVVLTPGEIAARGIDVAEGRYVALIVSDTGSGMDAETRARIFEPFFTTKGPGKGTGLGLATVYGIVKQSGGGITVESAVGHGCTFSIFLPANTGALDAPDVVSFPSVRGGSELILVVEDEEVVRQLICTVLSNLGYRVLCGESAAAGLRIAREETQPIDLLLTDIVMPDMHGPVLARELAPLQPRMKVLFVSGYSDSDISDQGVLDPGLDMLQKPFTQDSLARKVREILDGETAAATSRQRAGQ
ncbi:MAG TPA: ATP-binding protein [Chthoniobacterales bacterium]|jgi:signal transduction histidine kinase/CheY-like chemotaxis protein|nr:ATP-binding protein [Chthoniobacterales bacterium]